ncbi:IclR family transcriptional regulator [Microbacterium sp. P06]|uniref:IclR family transcriptional regulator n=1 Tax=unclassified Microbacterium TaxID=2609290 RepID=UPI0037468000
MPTSSENPISTTTRVAQVLLAFGGADGPLGVSEIARTCGLSKAVVHRILQSLVETHLVAYVPTERRYSLGPAAFALGRHAAGGNDLRAAGLPVISHLGRVTGETTTLTERFGHHRQYVAQIVSTNPIRITIRLGETVPLWSGASGLSILAFMDAVDIDYILSTSRSEYTSATVTDAGEIRARLAEIRERGWAHTAGERVRYSSSIAAPVFDLEGVPVGSLSVAYLVDRLGSADHFALAELVTSAAADASERLRSIQLGVPTEDAGH